MSSNNIFATIIILVLFLYLPCNAQLSSTFYDRICPDALPIIRSIVRDAVFAEPRMAASLIRLHFHDCFVQGCDASILLDDAPGIQSEKSANPNINSVRGFNVIEDIKAVVEDFCFRIVSCADILTVAARDASVAGCDASILLDDAPGIQSEKSANPNINSVRGFNVIEDIKAVVEDFCFRIVSCADILTVAARDASVAVGGPTWTVKLGRRDSTTANRAVANSDLPSPFSNLNSLISSFANKGLNAREMVVLSGSHTLGQAQCSLFRDRIYNATNIDVGFATTRRSQCPTAGGNTNLAPLDLVTPNTFDNNYYKNLMQRKGLLTSDQVLFNNGSADSIVREFSNSPSLFSTEFAAAMVKMSEISPLTGTNGIIRRVCSAIN